MGPDWQPAQRADWILPASTHGLRTPDPARRNPMRCPTGPCVLSARRPGRFLHDHHANCAAERSVHCQEHLHALQHSIQNPGEQPSSLSIPAARDTMPAVALRCIMAVQATPMCSKCRISLKTNLIAPVQHSPGRAVLFFAPAIDGGWSRLRNSVDRPVSREVAFKS